MTKGVGSGSGPWSVRARRGRRRPGCARGGGRRRRPRPWTGAGSRPAAPADLFRRLVRRHGHDVLLVEEGGHPCPRVGAQREQDVEHGHVAHQAAVRVDDRHRIEVDVVAACLGEPVGHFPHLVARLGGDQRGGHDAAGFGLVVAEEVTQLERRPGWDMAEHLGPHGQRQVSQRVDCLVGLHGCQQARRFHRIRLAQGAVRGPRPAFPRARPPPRPGSARRAARGVRRAAGPRAGRPARPGAAGAGLRWSSFRRTGAAGSSGSVGSLKGWMAAQSMTRSGVGRGRHRRGPRRRSRVAVETSAPTRRIRPRTSAK